MPAITPRQLDQILADEYDSVTPLGALECELDGELIVLEGTISWKGLCRFTRAFTALAHVYPLNQPEPEEGLAWMNDRSFGFRRYEPSGAYPTQVLSGGNEDEFLGFEADALDTLTFGSASSGATVIFTNHGGIWTFRLEQPTSERVSCYVRELALSGADLEILGRPAQLREELTRSLSRQPMVI